MAGFVEGVDRSQSTLFPASLEDYITEDNPVRAVDVFVDDLDLRTLGVHQRRAKDRSAEKAPRSSPQGGSGRADSVVATDFRPAPKKPLIRKHSDARPVPGVSLFQAQLWAPASGVSHNL